MSLSIPRLKFLLDENVRSELFKLLHSQSFDVKKSPRGSSDKFLSSLSLKEKRVFVTNDSDFCELTNSRIFSVVWLRLPQHDAELLLASFAKLLKELPAPKFSGKLIILESNCWKISLPGKSK
ncbi:MAG: DUF5615 family PIN-like protein [Patescibacteria group bacterium]